jgi:hypothetical protein
MVNAGMALGSISSNITKPVYRYFVFEYDHSYPINEEILNRFGSGGWEAVCSLTNLGRPALLFKRFEGWHPAIPLPPSSQEPLPASSNRPEQISQAEEQTAEQAFGELNRIVEEIVTPNTTATCNICNQPMPEGEEMFNYHGYSGPCPPPPPKFSHYDCGEFIHTDENGYVIGPVI